MDNRINCNSCGKTFEFDYRKYRGSNCIYCQSNDTEFVTRLPLIYHPRQFVQWPMEFKKQRYKEILEHLKNGYKHSCATVDERNGVCICKERDFQKEIVDYFLDLYEPFFLKLPFGLKTTKEKERYPLGQAIAVMEERPLWSPSEAITWYRRGNGDLPSQENTSFRHTGTKQKNNLMIDSWKGTNGMSKETHRIRNLDRLRGAIDIDIFNIAIELKIFRNQGSVRDLLAECMRDKIVADEFVIGVLIGFPIKEEIESDSNLDESERSRLSRVIQENLDYHEFMFNQVNVPLLLI